MLPYYMLVFIPLIIYLFGAIKEKKLNKLCLSIFFIILIALLALRSIKCGIDLKNYLYYYKAMNNLSFERIFSYSDKGEPLYFILNKIIILMGGDFQIFLFIVALISIIPIAIYYCEKSENAPLTIALFLTVAPFTMFFSGLRQSIAMGIIVFAFRYVENKKILKYIICIIIATLFHRSALYCLVLYPIYYAKITKNWLYVIVPSMIMIFIFNKQIFTYTFQLLNPIFDGNIESTGAYSILILLVLFAIYCFVFPNKKKVDEEFMGLRNILLLAIVIQCFAPIHATVMRINYYYLLFIPILITKVKNIAYDKNIKIVNSSVMIMVIFFISYFFYTGYNGNDILNIYPYIPFWKG